MPRSEKKPAPRKGARRMADVTPAVLKKLEAGEIEAMSLAEVLRINTRNLCRAVLPDVPRGAWDELEQSLGVLQRYQTAARIASAHLGPARVFELLKAHPSDTARGIACYALGGRDWPLEKKLRAIRPLTDDANSGVREWAWIAIRPAVAADLQGAFERLEPWTRERSANLRRYASEITRPRGVWCAHLPALRADPEPGLRILEPLRADGTKYVQDSVANWLNDAGKDAPEFVRSVTARWAKDSPGDATARIIRRAMRNL